MSAKRAAIEDEDRRSLAVKRLANIHAPEPFFGEHVRVRPGALRSRERCEDGFARVNIDGESFVCAD